MSEKEKKEPTSLEKVDRYLEWMLAAVVLYIIAQGLLLFAK